MKTSIAAGAIAGISLLLAGCGATNRGSQLDSTPQSIPSNAQVVQVQATNWAWKLDKKLVKSGEPIDFQITGMDGVHGFSIDGSGVSKQIVPGKTTNVVWTPSQPGTYIIRCNIYCGTGHDGMTTTFTVQ